MLEETLQFVDNQIVPLRRMVHVDTATCVDLEVMELVWVKKCEEEKLDPLYTGMDFLSDGRLVVVD